MTKEIIFTLILTGLFISPARATDPPRIELETVIHAGSVIPHHDFMHDFLEGPILAGEFKIGIQSSGRHSWEQLYNYPRYGIGIFTGSIGNTRVLGLPMGIYPFLDVPLLRSGHFSLNNQVALGLSFNHKQYHPVENPLNRAIGSDLNVFFYFNVNISCRVSKYLSMTHGVHFSHFSNGAVKMPNTGFYMLDGYLGLKYALNGDEIRYTRHNLPDESRKNRFLLVLSGGIKQLEPDGAHYTLSTGSLGYTRLIGRINRINLGADIFYDPSLEAQAGKQLPLHAMFRQGFYTGHELAISRISLLVQQGIYTYRKVNFHQRYYSRLALRYYIDNRFILNISLKSHWGKADYIEWGVGYIL